MPKISASLVESKKSLTNPSVSVPADVLSQKRYTVGSWGTGKSVTCNIKLVISKQALGAAVLCTLA